MDGFWSDDPSRNQGVLVWETVPWACVPHDLTIANFDELKRAQKVPTALVP